MPIWERYGRDFSVTAINDQSTSVVFHNQEDTDNFQNADVVIVDGIVTVLTNTDDLCGVRLLVAPEILTTADLAFPAPDPHDRMVYYSWFCGRGPLVFRLRSKRTIPPENRLMVQGWKEEGTALTSIKIGIHLLFVVKH